MLELYHSVNSVCAQKVRIALAEKGLEYREHLMTLRGDQFDAAYMKLNPNAVVPTLIHDGRPVIESSVILYYLDEAFPKPSLMPADPHQRAAVRLYNKLIDEYVHNSCTILTFATAFGLSFMYAGSNCPPRRSMRCSRYSSPFSESATRTFCAQTELML